MSVSPATTKVWGIVPAAGMGRRMGTAKQALPVAGTTMAAQVVTTLLGGGAAGVIVVTRSSLVEALDLPDDDRVVTVFNEDECSQMIDSIRIGLGTLVTIDVDEPDGVMVVPADMPTLTVEACQRSIEAFDRDPTRIIIATYQSRRGHPIVFPICMRAIVDGLAGGLNGLARDYPDRVRLVALDDPGVVQDVDTKADYDDLAP